MLLLWKTFLLFLAAFSSANLRSTEQSSNMSAQTFAQLDDLSFGVNSALVIQSIFRQGKGQVFRLEEGQQVDNILCILKLFFSIDPISPANDEF